MGINNAPPIALGGTSTNASLASLLGAEYSIPDSSGVPRIFKLVKTSAQITSPARKTIASALDGTTALPTWNVNTTTTANTPIALVISTDYSSTIATGTYILAQWSGPCETISAAAIAAFAIIGTSTTAGKVDDASITGSGIGVALEAAAGADENVATMLRSHG